MCNLFNDGTKLYKDKGLFLIERLDKRKNSVSLHEIESVVITLHVQITMQTVFELMREPNSWASMIFERQSFRQFD